MDPIRGMPPGVHGTERGHPAVGQRGPGDASDHGETDPLGEELSTDARRARSHGRPHGDLTAPLRGSRHEQVRHVDASDEQEHADGSHQQNERLAHIADRLGLKRFDERITVLVAWELFRQRPSEGAHLLTRLEECRVRIETSNDLEEPRVAGIHVDGRARHGHRDPNLDILGPEYFGMCERGGHDAHDGERLIGRRDTAPHDVGIRPVAPLPEPVADDHDRLRPHLVILGEDGAPPIGHHAQQFEEPFGHTHFPRPAPACRRR